MKPIFSHRVSGRLYDKGIKETRFDFKVLPNPYNKDWWFLTLGCESELTIKEETYCTENGFSEQYLIGSRMYRLDVDPALNFRYLEGTEDKDIPGWVV